LPKKSPGRGSLASGDGSVAYFSPPPEISGFPLKALFPGDGKVVKIDFGAISDTILPYQVLKTGLFA
jgi:hypothetical protein